MAAVVEATDATKLPPGFRFHPSDEEIVGYYLKNKVAGKRPDIEVIREIDLYKCEPWDLPVTRSGQTLEDIILIHRLGIYHPLFGAFVGGSLDKNWEYSVKGEMCRLICEAENRTGE